VQPTAKSLILDLLTAADGWAAPVSALIIAAEIFEITENNLRVALARLLSRGVVERDERGQYRIAASAEAVKRHVASWENLEDRAVAWQGRWIGVHTTGLPRGRRREARRQLRALEFLGLRELEPKLWVRPDNLRGGVAGVREQLGKLGLEAGTPVFAVAELDEETEQHARALWNVDALRAGYREMREAIANSACRLPELPLEGAMVECFVLGGEALRQIAFDPLLPEPILPVAERRAFVDAMRRYDRDGRACWSRFMQQHNAQDTASPLQLLALHATGPRLAAEGV
jgi:phenylacetic acid degradation operon negative regulatory protein